ncbi:MULTISPECIES: hypothetical protein [Chryseobacterium]
MTELKVLKAPKEKFGKSYADLKGEYDKIISQSKIMKNENY